ncbi:MAG: DUF2955 domain-containing protein [Kiritimatiellae bacterium]|nr:DUF2955 domain-containing protein [Kiritimatiellia bacterium]
MPLAIRRILRLSLTVGLSLAIRYAMGGEMPFMAPLFALLLVATLSPPMKPKALIGFVLLVLLTTSIGLMLVPLLMHYPATALVLVA